MVPFSDGHACHSGRYAYGTAWRYTTAYLQPCVLRSSILGIPLQTLERLDALNHDSQHKETEDDDVARNYDIGS